jgi:hypothetical protein
LDRFHRLFKTAKVGLNPASHVRNVVGNFSLLDMSTSTNKVKLIGMLHDEVSSVISGNQSKYWKTAESFGLFGVTFSAIELQQLHRSYSENLKQSLSEYKARNGSPIDDQLHFLDERLMSLMSMGVSKTGEKVSKVYGLIEGAFKTVAFKDYIQRWEAENKKEFPDGVEGLDPDKQQVVYSKAAAHANESIFDYSEVPASIRFLRRTPLGAPFLTFTYKAFPASLRAMVKQPMKFAQYAAMPALLTMLAAASNDWDDDDLRKIKSRLPDYYRHNPGVGMFPIKDDLGRPQIMDLSFVFPWSQWVEAARVSYDSVHLGGAGAVPEAAMKSMETLGALGGPVPQVIAAFTNGVNSFTGKPISTPGASAGQQLTEYMKFGWDLMTPAWLSSSGWLTKMYNIAVDKQEKDQFGDLKHTTLQDVADITGLDTVSVKMKGVPSAITHYDREINEIEKYRAKILRDRNIGDKANKLKDIAIRIKMVREEQRKELKGK